MRLLSALTIYVVVAPLAVAWTLIYCATLHYDDRPVDFFREDY